MIYDKKLEEKIKRAKKTGMELDKELRSDFNSALRMGTIIGSAGAFVVGNVMNVTDYLTGDSEGIDLPHWELLIPAGIALVYQVYFGAKRRTENRPYQGHKFWDSHFQYQRDLDDVVEHVEEHYERRD